MAERSGLGDTAVRMGFSLFTAWRQNDPFWGRPVCGTGPTEPSQTCCLQARKSPPLPATCLARLVSDGRCHAALPLARPRPHHVQPAQSQNPTHPPRLQPSRHGAFSPPVEAIPRLIHCVHDCAAGRSAPLRNAKHGIRTTWGAGRPARHMPPCRRSAARLRQTA